MSKESIPKTGDEAAERGSSDWCERWRLDTQCMVKNIFAQNTLSGTKKPMELKLLLSNIENGKGFTAWAKLKDQGGKLFRSFSSFCEAPDPYGLGVAPYSRFRQVLVNAMGDRAVQILLEIEPDRRGDNGDATRFEDSNSHHDDENCKPIASPIAQQRSRAISRAPSIAQRLYAEDCMGVQEAVKLGPRVNARKPPQEQLDARAKADEVGGMLERWVQSNPVPAESKERVTYKRQVNAQVREWLSESPLITVRWKADADADAIAAAISRKVSPDMLPDVIQSLANRSVEDE